MNMDRNVAASIIVALASGAFRYEIDAPRVPVRSLISASIIRRMALAKKQPRRRK